MLTPQPKQEGDEEKLREIMAVEGGTLTLGQAGAILALISRAKEEGRVEGLKEAKKKAEETLDDGKECHCICCGSESCDKDHTVGEDKIVAAIQSLIDKG